MSGSAPNVTPEIETFIQGYIDGGLNADGANRFRAALQRDPMLVRTLLEHLETDALIHAAARQPDWFSLECGSLGLSEQSGQRESVLKARNGFEGLNLRLVLPLAASILLLLGLLVWQFSPRTSQPVLAEVSGSVTILRETRTTAALSGLILQRGDVLMTAKNSRARIAFHGEATEIQLQPDTELEIASGWHAKKYQLHRGELYASVARQRAWHPMLILTPHAEARVLGTQFTLAENANSAQLDVLEGKVRFTRTSDHAALDVSAGTCAVATAGQPLAARPILGKVSRDIWLNMPGGTLQEFIFSPRFASSPSKRDFPESLRSSTNRAQPFGTRIRAYLFPPLAGNYIFDVMGNGQMRLFLSPDEDPDNKAIVSQVIFTRDLLAPRGTIAKQESEPIELAAGQRYYLELLHKSANGTDQLSVIWTRPDGQTEPIPPQYLAPFVPPEKGDGK